MAKAKCKYIIRPGRGVLDPLLCGDTAAIGDHLCPVHRFKVDEYMARHREEINRRMDNEEMKGV